MESGTKRRADDDSTGQSERKQKMKKQWRTPRSNGDTNKTAIQPGDSGIWATCVRGRERACVGELRDLFAEYAELLYGTGAAADTAGEATNDVKAEPPTTGIESEINAEVAEMQHPSSTQLITPIRIDVECVVFFKTVAPIEPVSFVKKICEDALSNPRHKRTRYTKRLSPITLMGRATLEGLEKVANEVLAPHFHQDPVQPRKFAIRPTLRNHNQMSRGTVIEKVAQCVGPGHQVDLKNYTRLVIIEIFQNVAGVAVLDSDFETLKRYNIAEIFNPTPVDEVSATKTPAPATKAEAAEVKMELDPVAAERASTA